MKCHLCYSKAVWVENKEVYGRNYGKSYMIWLCRKCGARVGCHKNTKQPLGTMADEETRELRKKAKGLFIDRMLGGKWTCPHKKKLEAYAQLAEMLEISKKKAHFAMFDKADCRLIIAKLLNTN